MPKKSPFTGRTTTITLHRNGLTFEIQNVPAVDAGTVAKGLLDVVRTLVKAGYDELVPDAGSVHGGVFGVVVDDDEPDEPAEAKRPIGFEIG